MKVSKVLCLIYHYCKIISINLIISIFLDMLLQFFMSLLMKFYLCKVKKNIPCDLRVYFINITL